MKENNEKKLKKPQKPLKKPENKSTLEFKRKYFEYYDDIKTSHKQDW